MDVKLEKKPMRAADAIAEIHVQAVDATLPVPPDVAPMPQYYAVYTGRPPSAPPGPTAGRFAGLLPGAVVHAAAPGELLTLVQRLRIPVLPAQTALDALARWLTRDDTPVVAIEDDGICLGVATRDSTCKLLFTSEWTRARRMRETARALRGEQRRLRTLSRRLYELHDASRALLGLLAQDVIREDLLQSGIDALVTLIGARYGAIGMIGGEAAGVVVDEPSVLREARFTQFVHSGLSAQEAARIAQRPQGIGLFGAVSGAGQSLRLVDMRSDLRSAGFPEGHPDMRSLLAVPVAYGERVYGRIYLCDKRDGSAFSEDDQTVTQSFANFLSLVLENAWHRDEVRKAQEDVAHMAHYDALTGLPNRYLFATRLQQTIAEAQRHSRRFAVMITDLDNFKLVNDSQGHPVGDALLKAVAERLRGCVREVDMVARVGGDEFLILLAGDIDAEGIAQAAQRMLQAVAQPFHIKGHELFAGMSIGIAPSSDGAVGKSRTINAEVLVKNADTALYHAKTLGKNNFQFFTAEMNARVQRHVALDRSLRLALKNDEFELHFQPQLALGSDAVVGAEALLRWQSPRHEAVAPTELIAVAEASGLIVPLGAWVLRRACREAVRWQREGLPATRVAVNVSARQFRDRGFVALVAETLQEYGLSPNLLEIEITESLLIESDPAAAAMIRALHALGVQLSLDDFGTGYSSLSYLKRFPVQRLKIDHSFVHDLAGEAENAALIAAIISMAHALKREVVAEGVESPEQLHILRSLHCDSAQGFYFAPAMASDEYLAWYRGKLHERLVSTV